MIRDKLFLLSVGELKKYLPNEESRVCKCAGFACWWWLRTSGSYTYDVASVCDEGCLYRSDYVYYASNAVRPALHLNPSCLGTLERTHDGCVKFGNGEWLVLDEDKGLLLSKEAVCWRLYDLECNEYRNSEIRTYLNTELLEMFTDEERKMIMDTVVDGEESHPMPA